MEPVQGLLCQGKLKKSQREGSPGVPRGLRGGEDRCPLQHLQGQQDLLGHQRRDWGKWSKSAQVKKTMMVGRWGGYPREGLGFCFQDRGALRKDAEKGKGEKEGAATGQRP